MKEQLKHIYNVYEEKKKDLFGEYKKSVEDFLQENGLAGDVYKSGRKGRLKVEYEHGGYEIKFYAYTKSGELSKMPSGYIWLWSPHNLDEYRKAEDERNQD